MTSHLLIEALELVFYIKLPYKGSVTMPSSSNTKYERTEVMYGTENTTNTILGFLLSSQSKMDICNISKMIAVG